MLRDQFTAIAATQPELVAHHFSEAGLPETAIEWWGKAAEQSLERSALVEAVAQLTRGLDLIATLACHARAASRRDRASGRAHNAAHAHIEGYAAPETKAAVRSEPVSLIEQAEALGEPPGRSTLLLFSVLYGFWANKRPVAHSTAKRYAALAMHSS